MKGKNAKLGRRIISVLLCALMIICAPDTLGVNPGDASVFGGKVALAAADTVWDGTVPETCTFEGSGTAEDPYLISTAAQLAYLSYQTKLTEYYTQNKYYKLTNDIDLNNHEWTPFGLYNNIIRSEFCGCFDGNGHTVSGMKITSAEHSCTGFFGYISSSGTVKGLNVQGSIELHRGDNVEQFNVGGIAGFVFGGSIKDCSFSGTIYTKQNGYTADACVGGIVGDVGRTGSTISNCYNAGLITLEYVGINEGYSGGIAGNVFQGAVSNCYNLGKIVVNGSSNGYRFAGGIIGLLGYEGSCDHCYNIGEIEASGSQGNKAGNIFITNIIDGREESLSCYHLAGTAIMGESEYADDGTELSAEQFGVLSNFEGFDSETWFMDTDLNRPRLKMELRTVSITPGSHMNLDSETGDESQTVDRGTAIADVLYQAEEGFEFPESYSVESINGISVTRIDDTQIKVSGTPTAFLTGITLPPAERKGGNNPVQTDPVIPYIPPFDPNTGGDEQDGGNTGDDKPGTTGEGEKADESKPDIDIAEHQDEYAQIFANEELSDLIPSAEGTTEADQVKPALMELFNGSDSLFSDTLDKLLPDDAVLTGTGISTKTGKNGTTTTAILSVGDAELIRSVTQKNNGDTVTKDTLKAGDGSTVTRTLTETGIGYTSKTVSRDSDGNLLERIVGSRITDDNIITESLKTTSPEGRTEFERNTVLSDTGVIESISQKEKDVDGVQTLLNVSVGRNGRCLVSDLETTASSLTIPATIADGNGKEHRIRTLATGALSECANLVELTLEGATVFRRNAFAGAESLKTLILQGTGNKFAKGSLKDAPKGMMIFAPTRKERRAVKDQLPSAGNAEIKVKIKR